MSKVIFTELESGALQYYGVIEDFEMQHAEFLWLKEQGYVDYERKKLNR